MRRSSPLRDSRAAQRGVVLPSPVVLLSVVAVLMAGIAFFATSGGEPQEKVIATVGDKSPSPSARPTASTSPTPKAKPKPKPKPVDRSKVPVVVFNNSAVKGLAATVGSKAGTMGWQVVGADNWYGNIPATTVYYPARLKAAGKQLALDLGIRRVAPSVDPMNMDRLTVILTAPLG